MEYFQMMILEIGKKSKVLKSFILIEFLISLSILCFMISLWNFSEQSLLDIEIQTQKMQVALGLAKAKIIDCHNNIKKISYSSNFKIHGNFNKEKISEYWWQCQGININFIKNQNSYLKKITNNKYFNINANQKLMFNTITNLIKKNIIKIYITIGWGKLYNKKYSIKLVSFLRINNNV